MDGNDKQGRKMEDVDGFQPKHNFWNLHNGDMYNDFIENLIILTLRTHCVRPFLCVGIQYVIK